MRVSKNTGKSLNYFIFFIFILIINLVFSFVYYREIGFDITGSAVLFLVIFSFNYFLLFSFLKNIFVRIIIVFLNFLILFYALVNFAYYSVFRTFWQISFGQISQINSAVLEMMKEYYYTVPFFLYLHALFFLVFLILGSVIFAIIDNRLNNKLKEIFLWKKVLKGGVGLIVFLVIFLFFNFSFNLFLDNYKKIARQEEFSREDYYSGLGVSGYIFDLILSNVKDLRQKNNIVKASNNKKDIDIVKDSILKLASLQNNKNSNNTKVKKLDKPHILIFQLESVSSWALSQEPSPMPYLSSLMEEKMGVDKFFPNSSVTINAELSSMCSFYSESTGPISDLFAYNDYYCLPSILKERYGYKTQFFHSDYGNFWNRDILNPRFGYDDSYFYPYFRVREDDGSVLKKVVSKIKEADKPTFTYALSFTSHSPFNQRFIDFNLFSNNLEINPYQDPLNNASLDVSEDEETIRNYFGFLRAVDDAIEGLFKDLEENDLLDNTIVMIYGDHRLLNIESDNKLDDFYNYNEVPFVMHIPEMQGTKLKNIASHVDIAPTILNILAGDEWQMPENFIGSSLFSENHPNSVINKNLGKTFYADSDIIIEYDSLVNITSPIAFLHKYAKFKIDDYEEALQNIITSSDRMIVENKLGSKESVVINSGSGQSVKKIDFNQATDIDGDGLSDLREGVLGTDRHNPDSDRDGHLDGVEVINGYDPLGPGLLADRVDTDGDGLSDKSEAIFGTDINNKDTDGDGYYDGIEVLYGHNPLGEDIEDEL